MEEANRPVYPVMGLTTGITKREYFAAMAMQGLLSNPEYTQGLKDNFKNGVVTDMNLMCVRESLDMADELIKQLTNEKS